MDLHHAPQTMQHRHETRWEQNKNISDLDATKAAKVISHKNLIIK